MIIYVTSLTLSAGAVILSLVTLPCWAIHLNIEPLMILLGQDPEVSRLAGEYILIFMPAFLVSAGKIMHNTCYLRVHPLDCNQILTDLNINCLT